MTPTILVTVLHIHTIFENIARVVKISRMHKDLHNVTV